MQNIKDQKTSKPDNIDENSSLQFKYRFSLRSLEKDGYVLLDFVNKNHLSNLDYLRERLLVFLNLFGRPKSYYDQPLVMDVKPNPDLEETSYGSTKPLTPHTDLSWIKIPPKYIALYCIKPDLLGGGKTILAESKKILKSLSRNEMQELMNVHLKFLPPTHIPDSPSISPILENIDGEEVFKLNYRVIRFFNNSLGENLKRIIEMNLEYIQLLEGQLLIIDNHKMLHGRTFFEVPSIRHFYRIYLVPN